MEDRNELRIAATKTAGSLGGIPSFFATEKLKIYFCHLDQRQELPGEIAEMELENFDESLRD